MDNTRFRCFVFNNLFRKRKYSIHTNWQPNQISSIQQEVFLFHREPKEEHLSRDTESLPENMKNFSCALSICFVHVKVKKNNLSTALLYFVITKSASFSAFLYMKYDIHTTIMCITILCLRACCRSGRSGAATTRALAHPRRGV